jgi:hypothetical protein
MVGEAVQSFALLIHSECPFIDIADLGCTGGIGERVNSKRGKLLPVAPTIDTHETEYATAMFRNNVIQVSG